MGHFYSPIPLHMKFSKCSSMHIVSETSVKFSQLHMPWKKKRELISNKLNMQGHKVRSNPSECANLSFGSADHPSVTFCMFWKGTAISLHHFLLLFKVVLFVFNDCASYLVGKACVGQPWSACGVSFLLMFFIISYHGTCYFFKAIIEFWVLFNNLGPPQNFLLTHFIRRLNNNLISISHQTFS